jgi:glycosyltransferase involved in cell wall biosynthesis
MNKNILIVATTSYAGMGPYVSEIVNLFKEEDENIYFFFRDFDDDYFLKNIKKELHEHSYFYKRSNTSLNTLIDLVTNTEPYYGQILDICKEKQIKVIHFINGVPQKNFVSKLRRLGIETLGTVHDLEMHEVKNVWYKVLKNKIFAARKKENISYCQHLLTNSPFQYEELSKRYPNKNTYYHSFPSLVTSEIVNGSDVVPELAHLDKPYILFFGRIEAYKGIDLLYDAFVNDDELINNYYLVIAGSGFVYFDTISKPDNVIIINRYIKDTEVKYLYTRAQCVVYPYISATQSGVLSLAFYFGCPTLVSDVHFFKSSVEDKGVGLIFTKGDKADLVVKLKKLILNSSDEMKLKQKQYYNSNYNGAAIKTALLNIYKKVCYEELGN